MSANTGPSAAMPFRRHILAALLALAAIGAGVWLARDRIEWPEEGADRLVIANEGGSTFECLFLFADWVTRGPERFAPGMGRTYDVTVAANRSIGFLADDGPPWRLEAIHCLVPDTLRDAYVRITPEDIGTAPVKDGLARLICASRLDRLECGFAD